MVCFVVVGTNCGPVAESLSSCLLKISGKAGGRRDVHTWKETPPPLLSSRRSTHHPTLSYTWGSPPCSPSPFSVHFSDLHPSPSAIKAVWAVHRPL